MEKLVIIVRRKANFVKSLHVQMFPLFLQKC